MPSIIKSQFVVDGVESEVISLSYSFDQNIDNIGQPAGEVRGGKLLLLWGLMEVKVVLAGWLLLT